MNKLVISPEAARDLEKIKQYIIYELKNPSAAKRVVRGITKDLRILEHYAEAGPSVAALTGIDILDLLLYFRVYPHLKGRSLGRIGNIQFVLIHFYHLALKV